MAIAIAVISWVASWITNDLTHDGVIDQLSALGQLAQNTNRAMDEYYTNSGHYPKKLTDLPIDTEHADGGNQSDVDHATYVTEGALAIIIFERKNAPGIFLMFRDGKLVKMKFLGTGQYE